MRFDGGQSAVGFVPASGPGAEALFADGGRARRPLGLTPLIDVVFLLVVFFMLASRFGDEGKLVVDVAAAAPDAGSTAEASRRIEIDDRGGVHLEGEAMASGELERMLARSPELPVLVLPAAEAPLQSIVSVLESVDAAGVTRAALAPAEEPATAGEPTPERRSPMRPRPTAPAGS